MLDLCDLDLYLHPRIWDVDVVVRFGVTFP